MTLEMILNWLDANWFTMLTGVFLTAFMLYGHSRGFLRLSLSIAAVLITTVLTRIALPPVTAFIRENTGLEKAVEQMVLKSAGMTGGGTAGASGTADLSGAAGTEEQLKFIDSLALPEGLREGLKENNTALIWEKLGAKEFTQYAADYLSRTVVHFVLFLLLFLIIWILLRLLIRVLDVVAKIPVIHGLNQIAGAVLGLAEGLFYLWLFFIVLSFFSGTGWGSRLMALVNSNVWLRFLYQYNLITIVLKNMLAAVL